MTCKSNTAFTFSDVMVLIRFDSLAFHLTLNLNTMKIIPKAQLGLTLLPADNNINPIKSAISGKS